MADSVFKKHQLDIIVGTKLDERQMLEIKKNIKKFAAEWQGEVEDAKLGAALENSLQDALKQINKQLAAYELKPIAMNQIEGFAEPFARLGELAIQKFTEGFSLKGDAFNSIAETVGKIYDKMENRVEKATDNIAKSISDVEKRMRKLKIDPRSESVAMDNDDKHQKLINRRNKALKDAQTALEYSPPNSKDVIKTLSKLKDNYIASIEKDDPWEKQYQHLIKYTEAYEVYEKKLRANGQGAELTPFKGLYDQLSPKSKSARISLENFVSVVGGIETPDDKNKPWARENTLQDIKNILQGKGGKVDANTKQESSSTPTPEPKPEPKKVEATPKVVTKKAPQKTDVVQKKDLEKLFEKLDDEVDKESLDSVAISEEKATELVQKVFSKISFKKGVDKNAEYQKLIPGIVSGEFYDDDEIINDWINKIETIGKKQEKATEPIEPQVDASKIEDGSQKIKDAQITESVVKIDPGELKDILNSITYQVKVIGDDDSEMTQKILELASLFKTNEEFGFFNSTTGAVSNFLPGDEDRVTFTKLSEVDPNYKNYDTTVHNHPAKDIWDTIIPSSKDGDLGVFLNKFESFKKHIIIGANEILQLDFANLSKKELEKKIKEYSAERDRITQEHHYTDKDNNLDKTKYKQLIEKYGSPSGIAKGGMLAKQEAFFSIFGDQAKLYDTNKLNKILSSLGSESPKYAKSGQSQSDGGTVVIDETSLRNVLESVVYKVSLGEDVQSKMSNTPNNDTSNKSVDESTINELNEVENKVKVIKETLDDIRTQSAQIDIPDISRHTASAEDMAISGTIDKETQSLQELRTSLSLTIKKINSKTDAFVLEGKTVGQVIGKEIGALKQLDKNITSINEKLIDVVGNLKKIKTSAKSDINVNVNNTTGPAPRIDRADWKELEDKYREIGQLAARLGDKIGDEASWTVDDLEIGTRVLNLRDEVKLKQESLECTAEEIELLKKVAAVSRENEERIIKAEGARKQKNKEEVDNAKRARDIETLYKNAEKLGKLEAQVDAGDLGKKEDLEATRKIVDAEIERLGIQRDLNNEIYKSIQIRQQEAKASQERKQQDQKDAKFQKDEWSQLKKSARVQAGITPADSAVTTGSKTVINALGNTDLTSDMEIKAKELQQAVERLDETKRGIQDALNRDPNATVDIDGLAKQTAQVNELTDEMNQLLAIHNEFSGDNARSYDNDTSSIIGLIKDSSYQKRLEAMAEAVLGAKLQNTKLDAATGKLTGEVKTGANEFTKYAFVVDKVDGKFKQLTLGTRKVEGFFEGIGRKMKEAAQYVIGSLSIYDVWNQIKQGVQYVKEIDTALTELKKVTDETEESYEKFLDTASETASKVGSTIKDVVSSTADFARLGYSIKEATELATSAQILMNVSEFTDISTATDSLISSIQAFKYTAEQSMDVVDILNVIGNNYAISTADLATSLTKSSGSLVAANGTLQEAVALTATANTIIQDSDVVGTALKTVAMRLRGTSVEEMEAEGLETDGVVSKSKLQGKVKALSGVDILTDTGAYKSTYQILSEIADVWESIDDMDQAALLELLAGKRAGSVMSAILQNPKTLKDAFESANDAAGSALAENEKYLDSVQGRIDLFNNAIQTMWSNTLDDDTVKKIIDIGTELVKLIDYLGLIKTLVTAIFGYFIVKYTNGSGLGGILFGKNGSPDSTVKTLERLKKEYKEAQDIYDESGLIKDLEKRDLAKKNLDAYKSEHKEAWIPQELDKLKIERENLRKDLQDLYVDSGIDVDTSKLDASISDAQNKVDIARKELEEAKSWTKKDYKNMGSTDPIKDRDVRIKQAIQDLDTYEAKVNELTMERDKLIAQQVPDILPDGSEQQPQAVKQKISELNTEIDRLQRELDETRAKFQQTGDSGVKAGSKLNATFKNVGKTLGKYAVAMLEAYAITTMFSLVMKGVDAIGEWFDGLNESAEEAKEKFDEFNNELSNIESELSSLESELDTTNNRIDELLDKDSLTLVEQEELNNLQSTNKELERQIELSKTLKEQQQKAVNNESFHAMDLYKTETSFYSDKSKDERKQEAKEFGETAGSAIGLVVGGVIGGFVGNPMLGAAVGSLVLGAAGGAIGSASADSSYRSELTVGEAMDQMSYIRAGLQADVNAARDAIKDTTKATKKQKEALQEAEQALAEFDATMGNSISQINQYLNAIDYSLLTDESQKQQYLENLKYSLKYNIEYGLPGAKSTAVNTLFDDKYITEELKSVKDEIEGRLDLGEDIDFWDLDLSAEAMKQLEDAGITVTDVIVTFQELKKVKDESLFVDSSDMVSEISKISDGISSLKQAFDEFNESGVVTAQTLMKLNESFGNLEGWQNYIDVMSSGVASTQEAVDVTNELAEDLLMGILDQPFTLTGIEGYQGYFTMLSQLSNLGVTNAKELTDAMQQKAVAKVVADEIKLYNELNQKKKEGTITDTEQKRLDELGTKTTEERIKAAETLYGTELKNTELVEQQIELIETQADLEKYKKYRSNFDGTTTDLLKKYNLSIEEYDKAYDRYKELKESYDEYTELGYSDETEREVTWSNFWPKTWESIKYTFGDDDTEYHHADDVKAELDDVSATLEQSLEKRQQLFDDMIKIAEEAGIDIDEELIKDFDPNVYGEGSVFNQVYDKVKPVIEAKTAELEAMEEELQEKLGTAFDEIDLEVTLDLLDKNKLIDDIQSIFNTLKAAAKEFNEEGYLSVDTVQALLDPTQTDPKYLALLYDQNGALNLNEEAIYRVAEAKMIDMGITQQKAILEQALSFATSGSTEAMMKYTTAIANAAEANEDFIATGMMAIATALGARDDITPEFAEEYLTNVRKMVDAAGATYQAGIDGLRKGGLGGTSAKDEATNAFQKEMDYWENRIGANQAKYEQIQNEIDLLEKQGKMAGEGYYQEQINLEGERKKLLEEQLAEAMKYQKKFAEGSDEWWEWADVVNSLQGELDDVTASIQDLSDAMDAVHWQVFDEVQKRFDNLIGKLDTIRDLISPNGEEDWFDDDGMWTEKGVASLATYIQQLEFYEGELARVNEEIKNLNINDFDSEQKYHDKLTELTDDQYDFAESISDTKQAVADMYEAQIDAVEEWADNAIDAYNDYIDVVKEALDAERDLHDFKKSIEEDTSNIAELERKIASLSGSTDAADIATVRKLQAELNDAKSDLDDKYYDHSMDAQQNALDEEASAYEKSMNSFVSNLRTGFKTALQDIDKFMQGVYTAVIQNAPAIEKIYGDLGLSLDDAIINPWKEASEAIKKYQDGDGENLGLSAMNSWITEGGAIYDFSVGADKLLTSPWTNGETAIGLFEGAVKTSMEQVVKNVTDNVATASTQLKNLYQQIEETQKKIDKITNTSHPGTSSGISGYDNGNLTTEQVKTLQRMLGLDEDGMWGARTQGAAMGMWQTTSADVAYGRAKSNAKKLAQEYINAKQMKASDRNRWAQDQKFAKLLSAYQEFGGDINDLSGYTHELPSTPPETEQKPKFKSAAFYTNPTFSMSMYDESLEITDKDGQRYYPFTNESGKSGYVKRDDGYNVIGGLLMIRARKPMYTKYAKGTLGTKKDEWAITDESWIGEEITLAAGKNGQLQYLKKGSAVMPADISANLVEWGKLDPNMMNLTNPTANINMINNAVNKPELNLTFDSLVHVDHCDEGTLKNLEKMVDTKISDFSKQLNYSIKRFTR